MKKEEKKNYLITNHYTEWVTEYRKQENIISDSVPMVCFCGRLATGLHISRCRKFIEKVESATIKSLEHLLPKNTTDKKPA